MIAAVARPAVTAVEGEGLAAAGSRLGLAGMMAGNPLHLEEDRELAGSPAEAAAQSQVQEVEPPSQIAQNTLTQSDNQLLRNNKVNH